MMRKFHLGLLASAALLLAACGSDSDKREVVSQFVQQQTTFADADIIYWSDVKGTERVTPQAMKSMRDYAQKAKWVKPGVKYATQSDSLAYVQVKLVKGGDTLAQTYYLNVEEMGVVGFK